MTQKWEMLLLLTDIFNSDELYRTKIQKMLYFASQKDVIENSFDKGYYGPYSSEIDNARRTMVEGRFLEERCHFFNNGYVGYSYSLTSDGKEILPIVRKKYSKTIPVLEEIVEICHDKTSDELSKAAKIHFIIKKEGKEMTTQDVINSAKELEWEITQEDLDSAIDLLLRLKLIKIYST